MNPYSICTTHAAKAKENPTIDFWYLIFMLVKNGCWFLFFVCEVNAKNVNVEAQALDAYKHTHYLFTEKWANFPFISIHSVNHLHIYTNFVSISYGVRSSAYNIWLHIILSKSLRTVYFLKSKWNSLRCKCIYLQSWPASTTPVGFKLLLNHSMHKKSQWFFALFSLLLVVRYLFYLISLRKCKAPTYLT